MGNHVEKCFEFDGKGLVLAKRAAYFSILAYQKKVRDAVLGFINVILGRQIRPKSNQWKTT